MDPAESGRPETRPSRMHPHAKGGVLMVAAAGCLVVNDALCKWLMRDYPAGQVIVIRGAATLAFFVAAALVSRPVMQRLTFHSTKLHAARAALIGLSALLFLSGLSVMPLANAVALSFTSPLAVAAAAGPLLGERLHVGGWIAIGVGFLGTLLVLNPSFEHYGPASILPALGGVTTAMSDLLTRRMSKQETSVSISMSTAVGTILVGACTVAVGWRRPDAAALTTMAAASVFFLAAYVLMAHAFRTAPAAYVAPFRYSALVWTLLIGVAIWGQVPDLAVLAGALLIVAAGGYLMRNTRTQR